MDRYGRWSSGESAWSITADYPVTASRFLVRQGAIMNMDVLYTSVDSDIFLMTLEGLVELAIDEKKIHQLMYWQCLSNLLLS
jgi:hypothetical protein